jgi:hypothetical protein
VAHDPVAGEPSQKSELLLKLEESIARAKAEPRQRPCPNPDPTAVENVAKALVTGAPIPPGAEVAAERLRRYERKHPGALRQMVVEIDSDLRRRVIEYDHWRRGAHGAHGPPSRLAPSSWCRPPRAPHRSSRSPWR